METTTSQAKSFPSRKNTLRFLRCWISMKSEKYCHTDRVIEYNPGVSVVAIKNVTINDDFFPGHFPERPIMPGVLMLEAVAQVGGIVMFEPDMGRESQEKFFFAGIDGARFRKPVTAGDTLVMRMSLVKHRNRIGVAKLEGKAYVGCDLVCEAEFILATGSTK